MTPINTNPLSLHQLLNSPEQVLMKLKLPRALLQKEGANLISLLQKAYPGLTVKNSLGEGAFGTVDLVTYEEQGLSMQRALKLTSWDNAHKFAEKTYRMTSQRFGGEWLSLLEYNENVIETFGALAYDEEYEKFVLISAEEFRAIYQNPLLLQEKSYLLLGTMMEYIENSAELFLPVKQDKITSDAAIPYIVKKILYGVRSLHKQGVMMRDLKLENILVTQNGIVKLIDFSFAKVFRRPEQRQTRHHIRTHSNPGSPDYIPTDRIITDDIDAVAYNEKTDIYSVAVIFFTMLFKRFASIDQSSLFDYHRECDKKQKGLGDHPCLDSYKRSNPTLVDFIDQMGHIDPKQRPTAQDALNHPLLLNV